MIKVDVYQFNRIAQMCIKVY